MSTEFSPNPMRVWKKAQATVKLMDESKNVKNSENHQLNPEQQRRYSAVHQGLRNFQVYLPTSPSQLDVQLRC